MQKNKPISFVPRCGYEKRYSVLIACMSVVLVSLGSICSSAKGRAQNDQAERPATDGDGRAVVKSIDFVSNQELKDKTLLEELDFEVGDYLDPILAESGRATVAEFYREKGFAYVRVMLQAERLSAGEVIYIIDEGPRFRIKSVSFEGNKAIKTGYLKDAVKIRTRSWLFWPVYYTEEKVAADVEKLRTVYYQRGYLNPRVEARGRSDIVFVIDEGPLYRVRDIILTGNTHFDDERLLKGMKLEPGQPYYKRKADLHGREILRLYRENGFVDALVQQRRLFTEADANAVDVEFEVLEGGQFRIGRVDISGNEQTQDKTVRRVLDEYNFSPGQLYNADMAPKQGGGQLEKYLQRRTLAEEVIIQPVASADGSDDRRDAEVYIQEGLTGMLNPGVSVGTDSGVMGQLIWQQRNFDIADLPESVGDFVTMNAFKGAGQTLRIALQPGTIVSQYSASFTEPYFQDKPTSLEVSVSSWERWFESHDERKMKEYVSFEKRLANHWRRSLAFRVENIDVGDLDLDAPQEIIDVKGDTTLAGARLGVGGDFTDDMYNPSDGYTFKASYEQATGDDTFGILNGTWVRYSTLYEDLLERKTVLATKLLAATTLGDAPPFEKFYAGGTGTYGISGFEYRGVSTRGLQRNLPAGVTPERKDPIGSDWIFLANAEITVPLSGETIGWLFFIDSGAIDTGTFRVSIGTGIQILIPQWLGPVPMRLELAAPLRRDGEDETQAFNFSMGRLY